MRPRTGTLGRHTDAGRHCHCRAVWAQRFKEDTETLIKKSCVCVCEQIKFTFDSPLKYVDLKSKTSQILHQRNELIWK